MKWPRYSNSFRVLQIVFALSLICVIMFLYTYISLPIDSDSQYTFKTVERYKRKVIIQGFADAHKYIKNHEPKRDGNLYLLFMSDTKEDGDYWCPDCQIAKAPIDRAFERAPMGSILAEIRVGSPAYWKDPLNPFRQNPLVYIDNIPTLMRYDGAGNSSAMLNEELCVDNDLLDYVFRVPNPKSGVPHTNQVRYMDKPEEVVEYLKTYDNTYPLFLFFLSGWHSFNGRYWCPYCDQGDVPVMHAFNYTASDSAVMLKVIVSDSYDTWDTTLNPFRSKEFEQKVIKLDGVPVLAKVNKESNGNMKLETFRTKFSIKKALIQFLNVS